MRRILVILATILIIAFLTTGCASLSVQKQGTEKPNIVFVLTDDMRADDLEHMPKVQELLVKEGTTFSNVFVPYPQCCPSRASILRGQYARNHLVQSNGPPNGGFERFHDQGHESSTAATWLKSAGYSTVLLGKYLNNYPGSSDESYVPPGWDEWYARLGRPNFNEYRYYDYYLNENGRAVHYGSRSPGKLTLGLLPSDYYTDVLARKAQDYVSRIAPTQQPFFMYVAVGAPHGPQTPAERHEDMFADEAVPRPPSFNEADLSDKPRRMSKNFSVLTDEQIAEIDEVYRNRLRTLQAVDEMVENLVGELQAQGEFDNTYIVFMSDNGWEQGEHRIKDTKNRPYEESIRVPLVVRGPGVPAGKTRSEFVLNTDIAPTFAELASVTAPTFVDGRSLRPLLTDTTSPTTWRRAFLLESYASERDDDSDDRGGGRSFFGIRTLQHKYVEHASSDKELYDLSADPYELDSAYQEADPALVDSLKARLETLKNCTGESCRAAEDGP